MPCRGCIALVKNVYALVGGLLGDVLRSFLVIWNFFTVIDKFTHLLDVLLGPDWRSEPFWVYVLEAWLYFYCFTALSTLSRLVETVPIFRDLYAVSHELAPALVIAQREEVLLAYEAAERTEWLHGRVRECRRGCCTLRRRSSTCRAVVLPCCSTYFLLWVFILMAVSGLFAWYVMVLMLYVVTGMLCFSFYRYYAQTHAGNYEKKRRQWLFLYAKSGLACDADLELMGDLEDPTCTWCRCLKTCVERRTVNTRSFLACIITHQWFLSFCLWVSLICPYFLCSVALIFPLKSLERQRWKLYSVFLDIAFVLVSSHAGIFQWSSIRHSWSWYLKLAIAAKTLYKVHHNVEMIKQQWRWSRMGLIADSPWPASNIWNRWLSEALCAFNWSVSTRMIMWRELEDAILKAPASVELSTVQGSHVASSTGTHFEESAGETPLRAEQA
eukprot:gnl/TRDRNA2_/TRDRNA2_95035_c0_seq1.p1 gnl/TRDRNA2_/TRDRNA2_95035_c0~~gnl/TRDRNA2_/TRDRNA2_95035_c0_seq1.p1  ORF type:complete len:442 (-),score=18.28 gnl/TRDRNA2_/TRDRNA2_95035_c0_seq1:60-1385(-)